MCLAPIGAQANESVLKTEAVHFSIFYFSHLKPKRKKIRLDLKYLFMVITLA